MKLFKEILKQIKKYDSIVIARHIGADPDALGSQFSLKELILHNFPNKKVYAVGGVASKFRFMGSLDKPLDIDYKNTLLIVLDTPDKKRIDGIDDINLYNYIIKIDHHPYVETYADLEYIEESSSTSQLIFKFIKENKLELTSKIAENIYIGIIGDTDRFLHEYTNKETLKIAYELIETSNIDFVKLYEPLYSRPIDEIRFEGYIYQNLVLTENNVAYIKLDDKIMKSFNVDSSSAGNMINSLKFVNEILVWVFFSEDTKMNVIKANIRSRGPEINNLASKFGGGGHKYASGVRLKSWQEVDLLIEELNNHTKDYLKELGEL